MKLKLIFTIVFFSIIAFAQTKPGDGSAALTISIKADSIMVQLVKDIGKYELFDLIKDIDSNIERIRGEQRVRLNELLKADVLYNRYDETISTLSQVKKRYENMKILQLKEEPKKN